MQTDVHSFTQINLKNDFGVRQLLLAILTGGSGKKFYMLLCKG